RVVDGRRFAVEAAGERGPLLVAQCDAKDVFSDIKLAAGERHPVDVVVLQRLGLPDESVRTVGWDDLDREVDADHLTTLYLPAGATGIHDQLVLRHPHVFGTVEAETAGQVMRNWEQIKREEKGRASNMDGIPGDLPSLLYAHKVQRKAASAGVEVEPGGDTTATTDEDIGALLFGVVALARRSGVDPEAALRATTARFRDEFMEKESSDG